MILPDLTKRIAWYQSRLRPEDERFGVGAADWTITCEYVADLEVDGEGVWGLMCSPSALPERAKLRPEDIAARRAHIVIRTPRSAAELAEIDRTILHELGHVLVAPLNLPRDKEEEVMHSLDHLFSKLTPDEGIALARAIRDPMARAYRAPTGGDMPDDEKDKDKPAAQEDTSEKDKPPAASARSVDEIKADMVAAVLAGQPTDELAKELVAAMALAAAPVAPTPAPVEPVAQGMKPEDAYARARKKDLDEAIASTLKNSPHLTADQQAMVRRQATAKDVIDCAASYPRPSSPDAPKMGLQGKPGAGGGKLELPLARAMREAEEASPRLRKILGLGSADRDGVHVEPGGGILIYVDGTERLHHQKATYEAARRSA